MKLSILLSEDKDEVEHRKELNDAQFLELLKSKAKNSHYIAKQHPFFKQDSGPDMMLVTPAQKEERSSFWIDKLIKDIQAWKKLPSRSRFLRAYTNYHRATETGQGSDVYVVIPLDSARVGISPGPSFYRSFTDIQKSLDFDRVDNKTFIDWLNSIKECLNMLSENKLDFKQPTTFSEFKKCLEKIDKLLIKDKVIIQQNFKKNDDFSVEQKKIIHDLLSRYVNNMTQYLDEKLDPEVNGFYSSRIESFAKGNGDQEVWMDKECLLIKRTKYIEMIKSGDLK